MKYKMNKEWSKIEQLAFCEEIRKNDGYCPCRIDRTEDTKCPCKEFLEQTSGECHCGLFVKEEENA